MTPTRRILCIRLDNIGDVLMTSPALRALAAAPDRPRLTLLTSPWAAPVAQLIPEIHETITLAAPWVKTPTPPLPTELEHLVAELRPRAFDLAITFTEHDQSPLPAALLAFLAGIPRRAAWQHEAAWQLLTDPIPDPEAGHPRRHSVERHLDLVGHLGYTTPNPHIQLTIPPAAATSIQRRLAPLRLGRRWILVNPVVNSTSGRMYPLTRLVIALRQLSDLGYQLVFTGTPDQQAAIAELRTYLPASHSFVGRLSLPELAALIQAAPLLLSNDSGPVHLAAGVGTPVVGLYHHIHAHHAPWNCPSRILYFHPPTSERPWDTDLAPQTIVSAVQALLTPSNQPLIPHG